MIRTKRLQLDAKGRLCRAITLLSKIEQLAFERDLFSDKYREATLSNEMRRVVNQLYSALETLERL